MTKFKADIPVYDGNDSWEDGFAYEAGAVEFMRDELLNALRRESRRVSKVGGDASKSFAIIAKYEARP